MESYRFLAASDLVSINFTSKDQLKSVPRIGDKVASAILSVTESGGNISEQVLCVTKGFYTKQGSGPKYAC